MNRPVNDMQLEVLRWVADGADRDNPPNDTFKKSASALKDRKLIKVSKRNGKWRATITELGTYYLEHGRYPQPNRAPSNRRRNQLPKPRTAPSKSPKDPTAVTAKPGPTPTAPHKSPDAIDIPTQLRHEDVRDG
jgi:hypothetical protein